MIPYQSEYAPTWKPCDQHRPPTNTKILLRTETGTAVIGTYRPDGGFTHWCGLPKLREKPHD